MTRRKTSLPPESEASFQRTLVEFARLNRWLVAHFRPAKILRANGQVYHATPAAADGVGFFDLVLVRERVIFAELKADAGSLRPEQRRWAEAMRAAGQEVHCWRPRDWDSIVRLLT